MPGITDFTVLEVATLIVDSGSGTYKIGFAGFYASSYVPSVVARPRCSASWPV